MRELKKDPSGASWAGNWVYDENVEEQNKYTVSTKRGIIDVSRMRQRCHFRLKPPTACKMAPPLPHGIGAAADRTCPSPRVLVLEVDIFPVILS